MTTGKRRQRSTCIQYLKLVIWYSRWTRSRSLISWNLSFSSWVTVPTPSGLKIYKSFVTNGSYGVVVLVIRLIGFCCVCFWHSFKTEHIDLMGIFFLFRLGQRRQTRGDGAVEVTHGVKDIRHTLTKHLNASVWWSNSKDQVGWNRQTKPNSYKIKDDRRRHRHMSRLPRRRKTNRVERKKRDQITKDISDKRLRTRDQRGTPRKKKRRQTIHRQNWGLKF